MQRFCLAAASAILAASVSPTAVLAQQAPQPAAPPAGQVNICEELVRFVERRGNAQPASPVALDQAREFQRTNNVVACRDGFVRIQGAGITVPAAIVAVIQTPAGQQQARASDGTNIVVQQPAPTVRVDQAAPTVTVQQPQPTVTVQQPTPEIIVRQPAPTVTVDIPQPEIILRMPRPDVDVAMAQPQVQVNQPRPQVQVIRPEQPQVQVEPAQPQVLVQRPANAQPNVQVQRADGQPQVHYERAEPRVVVNQAKGQPQVRVERLGEGQQAQAQPAQGDANSVRPVSVSAIKGKDVYNLQGKDLGEVERVMLGQGDQAYGVVKFGEFLGLGGEARIVPLSRMALRDDRLVIPGMSETEMRALPAWRQGLAGYREAEPTYRANLASYLAAADRAHDRAGIAVNERDAVGATGAITPPATKTFAVSALMDKEIYNLSGEQIGDIERVLMGDGKKVFVVVGHGGFLGLGEKEILLPLERIQVRGDRLVVQGLTDPEIRAMPEFKYNSARGYRELERTYNADIAVSRA